MRISLRSVLFPTLIVIACNSVYLAGAENEKTMLEQAGTFVKQNLIGKTLEAKITTKITDGKVEAEFHRRSMFMNFVQTDESISFDTMILIKQTNYDLDENGKRLADSARIEDRALVIRYGATQRKSTGELVGLSRLLTSSWSSPTGQGSALRIWIDNDKLVIETSTPLYADYFAEGGKFKPGAGISTTTLAVKDGKLSATVLEKGFNVDPKTQQKTKSAHDVTLKEHEVEGLF